MTAASSCDRECPTLASGDSAATGRERRRRFFEGVFAHRHVILEAATRAGECDPLSVW
jgi:hypothetical protein